jgi:hypothetical protein
MGALAFPPPATPNARDSKRSAERPHSPQIRWRSASAQFHRQSREASAERIARALLRHSFGDSLAGAVVVKWRPDWSEARKSST